MTITDNGTFYSFYCSGSPCNVGLWNGTGNGVKYTDSSDTVTIQKSSLSDGSYQWIASPNMNYFDMSFADWHDWKSNYDSMSGYGTFTISSAPPAILGCMDSQASNFNPNATVENYDCTYAVNDSSNLGTRIYPTISSSGILDFNSMPTSGCSNDYLANSSLGKQSSFRVYSVSSTGVVSRIHSSQMDLLFDTYSSSPFFDVNGGLSNCRSLGTMYFDNGWNGYLIDHTNNTLNLSGILSVSLNGTNEILPDGNYLFSFGNTVIDSNDMTLQSGNWFFVVNKTGSTYTRNSTLSTVPSVIGCMDSSAVNYNASANVESYDCTYPINENIYYVKVPAGMGANVIKEPLYTSHTIFTNGNYEVYKNWSWGFCNGISGVDCGTGSNFTSHLLTTYLPYYKTVDEMPSTLTNSYLDVATLPNADYYFYNPTEHSGLFFHMNNGVFTKIQNNFSAIFNPTCHDGIKNQDETSIDTGGICSVITTTHVDPFADCTPNVLLGFDVLCYIKATFQWLFTVDSTTITPVVSQFDSVKTHVPLNYIYYVSDFWTSLANGSATTAPTLSIPIGTSSITLFSASMLSSNPVAPLVRNSLVVVLWIMLAFAVYSRAIRLFHSDINPMSTNSHY